MKNPNSPLWKTILKGIFYSGGMIGVTVVSMKLLTVNVAVGRQNAEAIAQTDKVSALREGDPIPQIATVKLPLPKNYRPGQKIMLEVIDELWPHPFYFSGAVQGA